MNNQETPFKFDALKDHYADLYEALKKMTLESAASDNIDLLSQSLYSWFLWVVGEEPEQDTDVEKIFIIRESHLSALWSNLRLMAHLSKVDENWNAIDYLERQRQSDQE